MTAEHITAALIQIAEAVERVDSNNRWFAAWSSFNA